MFKPRSTRSWRNDWAAADWTDIRRARTSSVRSLARDARRGVVDLHSGGGTQGAQRFVAAGDDDIAGLQTAGDFDVADAGDAGFDGNENGFIAAHRENTLHLVVGVG